MKKMITSKRGRRFDEGGEVEDKQAGLAASNKEAPVGFFERLRMGNIDDPNSEAYRRFGAGRGRAERVPVEDRTPAPVARTRSEPVAEPVDEMEAANKREPIPVAAGPRAEPAPQVKKPVAQAPKAATKASKAEYDPTAGEAKDRAAQEAADAMGERPVPKISGESVVKKKPVSNAATFNAYDLNNFSSAKAETEKPKSTYKKNSTYAPSGKKAGTSKSTRGNDVDFGGTGLGMKRGGSVSKASSRADGIAQRGKTRGVMR
jgi:hypothetical protein